MGEQFFVEIRKYGSTGELADDEVVERMGPMDERKAERVDGGVNINLNHSEFYTLIVPVSSRPGVK